MCQITIAINNSRYRLQRIDATLKVRRVSEVTNQICSTHANNRIRASLTFIYRYLGKQAQLLFGQLARRK